jgi:hypothetical protein
MFLISYQISNILKPLNDRLNKNPPSWMDTHTDVIRTIKLKVKHLPCLSLPNPSASKIVETDASDIGYGGILKQQKNSKEHIIAFASKH